MTGKGWKKSMGGKEGSNVFNSIDFKKEKEKKTLGFLFSVFVLVLVVLIRYDKH